ncbi:hypothetical protein [Sedimenticola thiotaurini]|uniref:NnrS family protein n=1 Tax=Sedimenticola thiotaurini TaxID=1543721 RepID=A0A0F7JY91_9GAMM|nr:hypothetical protein [Sedimenticola thiotaurini]AKH19840.1 hypothetical protein AAY24_05155 [Sedimenticola thiotaurini]
MWRDLKPVYRYPILVLGMLSLLIGVLAGLGRLGVAVPHIALQQVALHGVLMIPAFFGTVIGLERAVAIGQRWAYAAPLFTGSGGVVLLLGVAPVTGLSLLTVGSLLFLIASAKVLYIQQAVHNWILLGGVAGLFIGNLLLLNGQSVNQVLYWWIAFLVLTIAGERLELSRLVIRDPRKRVALALLSLIPLAGAAIEGLYPSFGLILFAVGLVGIGGWLLLFDIARRTVRQKGLTRFTAVCMLAGYGWLLLAALLFLGMGVGWGGISRDAALHGIFLGFVFSMVIGHALIIFPAVTRLKIPYSPAFYFPMLLLQLSLLLRIAGGLGGNAGFLIQGAVLNALTLALFILTLLWSIGRGLTGRSVPDRGEASPDI